MRDFEWTGGEIMKNKHEFVEKAMERIRFILWNDDHITAAELQALISALKDLNDICRD